jgi:glutathione S-transferase
MHASEPSDFAINQSTTSIVMWLASIGVVSFFFVFLLFLLLLLLLLYHPLPRAHTHTRSRTSMIRPHSNSDIPSAISTSPPTRRATTTTATSSSSRDANSAGRRYSNYPVRPFELISIRVSHFNEKARWVLDLFEVPYIERPYMPVLHMFPVLRSTRGIGQSDDSSSFVSTPVLITDTGSVLHDSRDIVHYVDGRFAHAGSSLFPNSAVRELDREFHATIGPLARRIAYYYASSDTRVTRQIASANVGETQARLFNALYPLIRYKLIKSYGINRENVARDEDKLFRILDAVAGRLLPAADVAQAKADGRGTSPLVGDISYDDDERSNDTNLQRALSEDALDSANNNTTTTKTKTNTNTNTNYGVSTNQEYDASPSTLASSTATSPLTLTLASSTATLTSPSTLALQSNSESPFVDDDEAAAAALVRRRRTRVPKRGIYICGDRFTAADLTFASMLAPLLLVQPEEGFGARMPSLNEVPFSFRRLVERVREHPAGAFALRMFAEERGIRVLPCTVGNVYLPSSKL